MISMNSEKLKVEYMGKASEPEHKLSLWYRMPATDWEKEALPIGNGFIGGMIFGGVHKERIQYNEISLWEGGPGQSSKYKGGNIEGAADHLQSIRNNLSLGKINEAKEESKLLTGSQEAFGAYQAFGDFNFDYQLPEHITISNYRRELDLEEAIARVSYEYEGVVYTREYFCSNADKVMVCRLKSSKEKMLNIKISTSCDHRLSHIKVDGNTIITRGQVEGNAMIFESRIKVLYNNGEITSEGQQIIISKADEIIIFMNAGTDYYNSYPTYKGEDPSVKVKATIEKASNKKYKDLLEAHKRDYIALFSRVSLSLNDIKSELPTNELRENYSFNNDRSLEVLMFQYGRYLIISSSREGSLPANLQGLWNNSNTPPWCGDYHFNINLQMNYWHVGVANLSECMMPLIDYVGSLVIPGRITAEKHFGVKNGGWVVNTMNNIFGYTAPGWNFNWGWAPNSNAFICENLWEHYLFTQDINCFREKIYPIMKEAALFWSKYLVEDKDGTLVSSPSYSPEQGEIAIGAAMDQQLAFELFSNVIEASRILGVDEEFRNEIIDKRNKLSAPVRIGRWGQVQEWKEDIDDPENNHRHLSNLVSLYPGKTINRKNNKWLQAAKITMIHRGDESTGWSRANKINLWARALDGNHAYKILQGHLEQCTYSNLFDTHPPFQIDGNFGFTSGVCEMLLQSHLGEIELLPALPDAWQSGEFKGLVARGAFEIDMNWENKKPVEVIIRAKKENFCKIKNDSFTENGQIKVIDMSNNQSIKFIKIEDIISFNTKVGTTYKIIF